MKKLKTKVWDWLTQFSMSYAIGTILVVTYCLWFNGYDKVHVFIEFNSLIRNFEIIGGIISLVVLLANFFSKLGAMAERR